MDGTVQEAQRFLDNCYQIQDRFSTSGKEIKLLKETAAYSKQFLREFSAGGLFYIDKTLITGVMGNVATYMIITTQFNQN